MLKKISTPMVMGSEIVKTLTMITMAFQTLLKPNTVQIQKTPTPTMTDSVMVRKSDYKRIPLKSIPMAMEPPMERMPSLSIPTKIPTPTLTVLGTMPILTTTAMELLT